MERAAPSGAFLVFVRIFHLMDNAELVAALNALPEKTRLEIERLVALLKQQAPVKRLPPIMRSSEPLTEEEKRAEHAEPSAWAARTDIINGAEYIHAVRRRTRQP